jgi:hypothetical protein
MADCIIAKITDNLIAAMTGKSLTYAGAAHTTLCRRSRLVYDNEGSDCFIELCGPWPELLEHAGADCEHEKLNYVAYLHPKGISDVFPADPITVQTKNIGADVVKLVVGTDNSRGGYALKTQVEGQPGYFFEADKDAPEFVIYIVFSVDAFINANDPYLNG